MPDPMRKIPIALQLYSIRKLCGELGFDSVFKEVAAMGYEGVEFAGFQGREALEISRGLDAHGLLCAGSHTPMGELMEDRLEATLAFNRTLGNRFIIVPGLKPEYRASIDAWKKTASWFNRLAGPVEAAGLRLGYHNHASDFEPVEGQIPWDLFRDHTSSRIIMQADTGNALAVGVDLLPFIRTHPERVVTVHLKDQIRNGRQTVLGEGDVNWRELLRACSDNPATEWLIIEQEAPGLESLDCVRASLENLQRYL